MLEISSHSQLLTARWVAPVSEPLLEEGAVVVSGDKIVYAGRLADLAHSCQPAEFERLTSSRIDYPDSILVPGLINLHTHLDYSFASKLSVAGGLFVWMRHLVEAGAGRTIEDWRQAARLGAETAALAGTTCVVDSSFTGASLAQLAAVGLRGVVGLELFGGNENLAETIWQQWLGRRQQLLDAADTATMRALQSGRLQLTVAPHAPYTVSPRLWRLAHQWAGSENLPLTAHVAESLQECQWIESNNDELDGYLAFVRSLYAGGAQSLKEYDYLKEARDTAWKGHGLSPVQHLAKHGLLSQNLLAVHLVHVDAADIQSLSANQVGVALCPRSNDRLGNGLAPLPDLAAAGLQCGFGTDSLASTPDLSLLAEVAAACRLHSEAPKPFAYDPARALASLTLDAARAIGRSDSIGSLAPGKQADISVFALAPSSPDPLSALFHGNARPLDIYVAGQRIVAGGRLKKPEHD